MGSEYRWEGLDRMEQELAKMIDSTYPTEFKALVVEIARELQTRTKEKTSIGPTSHLVDGWKVGPIKRVGDSYVVEVYNNVEYAEPVEYGHRTRRGTGKKASKLNSIPFVPGVHMMEITMEEISREMPDVLRDWMSEFIVTHDL